MILGKDVAGDGGRHSDEDVELSALPLLHEDKHLTNYTELDTAHPDAVDSPVLHRKPASATGTAGQAGSGSSKGGYQSGTLRRSTGPAGSTRESRAGGVRVLTRKEIAARTPWTVMLTHPVALALMWCSFGYVSIICYSV
jgi:hypothetical protein